MTATATPAATVGVPGSELRISRLGLGCARVFGGSELRQSARLLHAALDAGIRHFDTAPSYAYGQSEVVLGEILGSVAGLTIATKVGLPAVTGSPGRAGTLYRRLARPLLARAPLLKRGLLALRRPAVTATVAAPSRRVLLRDELAASVEQSLARLRRQRLDLLLVHEPEGIMLDPALQEAFADLQRAGLVTAFGLAYGRAPEGAPPFGAVLQGAYRGVTTRPAAGIVPLHIFHGVLRQSWGDGPYPPAPARIRAALQAWPDAAILFSASVPAQLREVARGGVAY
jgi:aryl-alcohol dehydrogenase-like predicted oxidoreductase